MIHIKKSANGQYFVSLVSKNGKIINSSETLTSKQMALKNIFAAATLLNSTSFTVMDHAVKGKPVKRFFERVLIVRTSTFTYKEKKHD